MKLLEFSHSACRAGIVNQSTILANAAYIRIFYKRVIGLQKDLMFEDMKIAHCCWALQNLTLAVSFFLFNLSLILNTDFSILSYTYLGLSDRTCQMFSKHIRKMGHFV